jgi:hypothetical protein
MNNIQLSRRRVMQLLATTMAGSSVLPLTSLASSHKRVQNNAGLNDPLPVLIPPGAGKKGNIAVN